MLRLIKHITNMHNLKPSIESRFVKRNALLRFFVVSIALSFMLPAGAQKVVRESNLLHAVPPATHDAFGQALAATPDFLAVGAPGIRTFRDREPYGAVHIYRRGPEGDLDLVRTILGPTDSHDRRFGVSLALDGDVLAVGSSNHYSHLNQRGRVHFYHRNLPTPDAWGFAASVDVEDGRGTFDQVMWVRGTERRMFAGFLGMEKVAVIERSGLDTTDWHETAGILDPNSTFADGFGYSLDVEGDELVIGAPYDDQFGDQGGAVHIYRLEAGTWNVHQTLASRGLYFGLQVERSGDWLAVLASSSVLLYRLDKALDEWSWVTWVTRPEGIDSMSLEGDELLVGNVDHNADDLITVNSGEAVLYRRTDSNTWTEVAIFLASDPEERDQAGGAVLITPDAYVVGSNLRNTSTNIIYPGGKVRTFNRPAVDDFQSWRLRHFDTAQLALPLSEVEGVPNDRGIPNMVSYQLGLDPFEPDPSALSKITMDANGAPWFEYSFRPNALDLVVSVDQSSNLQEWEPFRVPRGRILGYANSRRLVRIPLSQMPDERLFLLPRIWLQNQ